MRTNNFKTKLKAAVRILGILPFAAVVAFGQQTINLTASPTSVTLPDGSTVPMWGYFCGTPATNTPPVATCAALNPASVLPTPKTWSPVVITVPAGQALTINLTNNLSFLAGANNIPTSMVVVGQIGGGLGILAQRTTSAAPDHSAAMANATWFIANTGAQGTAPAQGPRVRSFGTEVQATPSTTAQTPTALTWGGTGQPPLRPGTYLLESGTHPSIQVPMGLYGILVVTAAPTTTAAGTAYPAVGTNPAVTYNAEVPLEFSEIDPVQNKEVDTAVRTAGFSENATMGTYLGGSISHVYVASGGSGYTTAPTVTISGGGAISDPAKAVASIDTTPGSPTFGQVIAINVTYGGTGYTSTPSAVITGGVGGSGAAATPQLALGTDALAHCAEGLGTPAGACYPPAVNYTPFYYLINGTAFNKTNPNLSLFPVTSGTATAAVTGNVLVRLVNAGSRMHVPAIVGSQTTGYNGAGASATVTGFTLIAEDGNVIPGAPTAPRVQTDVFMAAGKTFDVMITAPAVCTPVPPATTCANPPAIPIYDRQLSLSGNASERDAGMLAYIGVNNGGLPGGALAAGTAGATANPDSYPSLVAGQKFKVSDVSKGLMANDVNVYGVQLLAAPTNGTLTQDNGAPGVNANGTFTYTPAGTATSDTFTYCANGTVTAGVCSSGITATVTLGPSTLAGNPVAVPISYTAKTATYIKIPPPGVLSVDSDPNSLPLTVVTSPVPTLSGGTLIVDANGGFNASVPGPGIYTFSYTAQNSQGRVSSAVTVTLNFPQPSNLAVTVVDAKAFQNCAGVSSCISSLTPITDYRWLIEEDKTFYVDPNCTKNTSATTPGCPSLVGAANISTIPTFAVNFHTSHMEQVAMGCTGPLSCESGQKILNPATGTHVPAVCDVGTGACDMTRSQWTAVDPKYAVLDPKRRYYISILPGDAANPFNTGNVGNGCTPTATTTCPSVGHGMGGSIIPAPCNIYSATCASTAFAAVTVLSDPTPFPTGRLSAIVYEDDFPLNGEQDSGGGVDVVSPNEPGLGGFELVLWDAYGQLGDTTGQMTHDMFNQPLGNSLDGTIDPNTGFNACPISAQSTPNPSQAGITGRIVTCPKYESDNKTLSPLAGQAVVANLMQGKFNVQAYPAADRIARGEEWIQTNTLDGQHPHDSFIRIGEPSYFQEYGPAGYHVSIGFANPKIINGRHDAVCTGAFGTVGACNNTIKGQVVNERMSRTPDQRLYPSGSRDALAFTQCWVSLGDPDAEDFMFTKCDANGNFVFNNVPGGQWRLTTGDQWNDQIIDGLSTPANVTGGQTLDMGQIGVQQWQSDVYTRTCIDENKDGVCQPSELGVPFLNTTVRYRDGEMANNLVTDFNGTANFNETFPLFNWYVVEADITRYKTTGTHTVVDAGGPADGSTYCGNGSNGDAPCGKSAAYNFLANTYQGVPLPADLSVPGAVYCATADCAAEAPSFAAGIAIPSTGVAATSSTGRIDPPWAVTEAWTGEIGEGNWIEFGKAPYAVGETGGIHGHVVYASTRPFDDASELVQLPWEPLVPRVTINLYQEGFASDGVTPTLKLVDTTTTTSWDDWAQGFYPNSTAGSGTGVGQKPYMSCPGQMAAPTTTAPGDLFFFTLYDQPLYLDLYNSQHNGGTLHTVPYNSQFRCYDAMHIWNQIEPAPYDGMYAFPSVLGIDPTTGKSITPAGVNAGVGVFGTPTFVPANMPASNCTICVPNPDSTDKYRFGTAMLPPGKYVVEAIAPPGYEHEKEEDKNLLIGDNYIAPVTQEFGGLGGYVFIMPDQASVASQYDPTGAGYNPNNAQNATTGLGAANRGEIVPAFFERTWPCVGEMRVVPDYLSLFPQALEVAPFAGATRPLCDRKEVALGSQTGASSVKFFIFTTTHIASKFTGVITDDFTSEFDPFSPQFGEKFAPPNMPIASRDWMGNEVSRVYSDHFGVFNGMIYSSWEVDPPNITGYSPNMMVQCMNDPGPIPDPAHPGLTKIDDLYNPAYSDFCYELPYMPGVTSYLDTPVVPTQAFVGAGYNNPDCAYPDATPAISEVDGDGVGPWVAAAAVGHSLTITGLGDQLVNNYGYSGASASADPYDLTKVTRHYGFGAQCTTPVATSATCNTLSSVKIGGVTAPITSWSDTTITVTAPAGVPACTIQQQAQYGGSAAQCGQLVITAGNGKQSIDSVTVTIGGKAPTHVSASGTIQSAIDAALPGDLIIVDPTCTTSGASETCTKTDTHTTSSHSEMLLMWKPVRLQGAGAASTIINANATPAGKLLDPWRRHINCLFGLTLQGVPYTAGSGSAPYDPAGVYSCPDAGWNALTFLAQPNSPQVDRLPLEGTIGWDATLNGNLGELLQEPSLMGAFEGAGITVLAKGVDFHGANPFNTTEADFPVGTTLLTGVVSNPGAAPGTSGALRVGDNNPLCKDGSGGTNRFPSNYMCNPSSIDGLSIANSSQGGGGVFVHGWAHFLQVANNRIFNNAGSLSGGISVGQGEFGPPYIQNGGDNGPPGSCSNGTGFVTNQHLPWCLQNQVNVHNNMITSNSAIGDELFSATLSGGGGATICTGNDYYKFNYNWVCGNISAGEGGGIVHLGEIFNGDIEHNSFLFNQSSNPTIPTNGGGIMVQGTADTDPVCPGVADADCPPGLSDGTGPGLVINANLIQGNSADSGSGGGIRLQAVNGTEVSTFPHQSQYWHDVTITNNIIVNNMAGWDGAGISLQDALKVNIINNTIAHNDTLATSGVLTNSIGTPSASAPAGNCTNTAGTASCPQSAGVTSTQNSGLLTTTFTGLTLTCPAGHAGCQSFSNPLLVGDVLWQNRSFYVGVSANLGTGSLNQQDQITLFSAFTNTPAPAQATTGACATTGVTYWDLGVRGDKTMAPGGGTGGSGFSLNPSYSVLSTPGYAATNLTTDPLLASTYCNGSRVPPECTTADGCGGLHGFGVPPGIADAVVPNPVFSLVPSATVDEGNNWINVSWGPLALTNPSVLGTDGNYGAGAPLGNYVLATGSPAIDYVPTSGLPNGVTLPTTDFFGNPRPDAGSPNRADVGAVETLTGAAAVASVTPTTLAFGNVTTGTTSASQTLTLHNTGGALLTGITVGPFSSPRYSRPAGAAGGTCGATLAAGTTCTITVVFSPTATGLVNATLPITASVTVTGSPVSLSGTGVAAVISATLTPAAHTFAATTRGVVVGPTQAFTLTNTGNVTLTGIAQGALGGTNSTEFTIVRLLSTCGPATGGQLAGDVTLAPGATCNVEVMFKPLGAPQTTGVKNATVSVTDSAGTQTSTLTGTAN
jgi:hypothetical protein